MSGAWWPDLNGYDHYTATSWVAMRLELPSPQGPVVINPDAEWEKRLIDSLQCCNATYQGACVVKGGSPADKTFNNVMGVGLAIAWIIRGLEENDPLDIDALVSGMTRARVDAGWPEEDCRKRATKLVLDACGEYLSLTRLARHSLATRVTYSATSDARGVDAVLKLWRRPESSVQVKRSYKPPPSSPGRWNINVHYASGESEWIEPASVAIATAAAVDAYVKVCTASADAAVA